MAPSPADRTRIAAHTLTSDAAFQTTKQYTEGRAVYNNEIGTLAGIRFVTSSNAKVFPNAGLGAAVDVYTTLVMGADAYGIVDLAGQNLRQIAKELGSAGSADPLDQRKTWGWKVMGWVAKILDENRIIRLEHAISVTK